MLFGEFVTFSRNKINKYKFCRHARHKKIKVTFLIFVYCLKRKEKHLVNIKCDLCR